MFRFLRRLFEPSIYSDFAHPSWRVVYAGPDEGTELRSAPLRYNDALARKNIFDGLRVEYARDKNGNLLP